MSFKGLMLAGTLLTVGSVAHAQEVTVSGCARAGVESGCVILQSGGQTYNISSATPRPQVNTCGTVRGRPSNNPTTCMQGTLLSPATWEADPQRNCNAQ